MTERRSRTRRPQPLRVIPAMLLYLAVMTLGPWLHLRAHDAAPEAAVEVGSPSHEGAASIADACEVCRVLGGPALHLDRMPRGVAAGSGLVAVGDPAAALRRCAAITQARAPPAPPHTA